MEKTVQAIPGFLIYRQSITEHKGTTYFLGREIKSQQKVLGIRGNHFGFAGRAVEEFLLCPLTSANATALRLRLPWLNPSPLGLKTSAGCGDRLGLATPGHVRAVRTVGGIAPVFAQQSMRENTRTGRTPQQVVDEAMWGVFQEGWREPWGADADHLKTTADIDICVAAGYTMYTIDPGTYVDNDAHTDTIDQLDDKYQFLPWEVLNDNPKDMRTRYLGAQYKILEQVLNFTEVQLLRAACKYGHAIAHTARLVNHLISAKQHIEFDLEISVDETETPTSPLEHIYIACELKRLGIKWVSLAPRYIGRFEKGVDYIGELHVFDSQFALHAAIARQFGPYKLSIHSGSDKFSIYPTMTRHTQRLAHLKTAGTSYLEALRAVAQVQPDFFRDILTLAIAHYDEDRASYHVSAEAGKIADPNIIADNELSSILDTFDGREVLHVTFGSVLERYREKLYAVLESHEQAHYAAIEKHFIKHLIPFTK
jgi:hypothetical protein